MKDVIAELHTSEGRTHARDSFKAGVAGAKSDEIAQRALAGVTEVARIVDAKGGADALRSETWLLANAKRVAEASTEGGFLGFGGVKVSDKERATFERPSALGVRA